MVGSISRAGVLVEATRIPQPRASYPDIEALSSSPKGRFAYVDRSRREVDAVRRRRQALALSRVHEARLISEDDKLCAITRSKLDHGAAHMSFGCRRADDKALGDLVIG